MKSKKRIKDLNTMINIALGALERGDDQLLQVCINIFGFDEVWKYA